MKSAKAFAPANISCIFRVHRGNIPETTGSTGVGFTLKEGVTVTVTKSNETRILFNHKQIEFPTVGSVIDKLSKEKILVSIRSKLPLGGGFGLSGASALATAYAVNDFFDLEQTKLDLAKIAHVAEVQNKTGLGDVVNQYYGGFLLKTKPSYKFEVIKIQLGDTPVYCKFFSKLSTESVISNNKIAHAIDYAGKSATEKVLSLIAKKEISFSKIIEISKEFSVKSGLLNNSDVIETIKKIEAHNGHASMIMLGNGVFSDIPFEGSTKYKITS